MVVSVNATRGVTILGATGSIGCNTVRILLESEKEYKCEAITAHSNVALLAEQAKKLQARYAVVADETHYTALKEALSGSNVEAAAGTDALVQAARQPADWVMSAIVGSAGLYPTMAAIERGATVALANKECLVCAGELMMAAVKQYGATLIPVDSEHNAIFQLFDFERPQQVAKIILTASGGPFRQFTRQQMEHVTLKQAVAHPNWDMGTKISIDSATMMNKGLELIEAYHLFPVGHKQLEVLVHPESVIHSMVEYIDGSTLAQLGTPDMCMPISYALAWPQRMSLNHQRLDLAQVGKLTFEAVNEVLFPNLRLAREALEAGGTAPAILNTANEVAVQAFIEGRIGFLDISRVVEAVLHKQATTALQSLDDVETSLTNSRRVANDIITTKIGKVA